jgi:hypothetical protein
MSGPVCSVPAPLFDSYAARGVGLIVRAKTVATLLDHLGGRPLDAVASVRVTSKDFDPDALREWPHPVPIDLLLMDPAVELPILYHLSELPAGWPVRVSIPVQPGFAKAVYLAAALHFPVNLEVGQPTPSLVAELLQVLDVYLHRPTIRQPIEFFHSVLMAFYHETPATLWGIQGDDPGEVCYVSDGGKESLPPRFAGLALAGPLDTFVETLRKTVLANDHPCRECEFLSTCCGYFRWPNPAYCCDGVKAVFGALREAACSLRSDLSIRPQAGSGARP